MILYDELINKSTTKKVHEIYDVDDLTGVRPTLKAHKVYQFVRHPYLRMNRKTYLIITSACYIAVAFLSIIMY